jgi:signal transduction histidine kinase/putative methionine-R-sulfoxide reductase with GAF domain/CheY-like chemotaxis protein
MDLSKALYAVTWKVVLAIVLVSGVLALMLASMYRPLGALGVVGVAILLAAGGLGSAWLAFRPLFKAVDRVSASLDQAKQARNHYRERAAILDAYVEQLNAGGARWELRLGSMAAISREIAAGSEPDVILARCVELLQQGFAGSAALLLLEPGQEWVALEYASGDLRAEAQNGYWVKLGDSSAIGACAATRKPALLHAQDGHFEPILIHSQALMVAPLLWKGALVGVLDVEGSEAGAWDEVDLLVLVAVAGQIASAIVAVRRQEELEQARQDLVELERRYVQESWAPFSPQAAGYRWQEGRVSALGHRALPESAQVFSSGQTLVASGSGLVAPIRVGGQILGALGIQDSERAQPWTADEVDFLESVAAQMGMAIQNVRLIDEARARLAEITALHKRYLREEWQEFVPTQPRTEYTFAQPGVPTQVALDREWEEMLSAGTERPASIKRPRDASILAQTRDAQGAGGESSALLMPIALREHVYGALGLEEVDGVRQWSEEELAIVEAVTDRVAMAVENARLFAETERRAVELERTAEQLRETDKFRAQFLATMSHELRTPLNSIIGFSRVILKGIDGPLTDLQKTDLEAIYNSGQHLLQMINDILDMSKIEAGMMELVVENVDLDVIVRGVISTSSVLVKDRPVEVRTEIEPDLPVLRADGARVRQVMTNLMSNACKFTDEGTITLRAWQDRDRVYISVEDTGSGIPEDKKHLVFDQFRQVDSSSTRRAEGTGLGLPISRYFVRLHGGDLDFESQEGVGSTFTFWLPIEGPVEEIPELADFEIDESKRLLLVVEQSYVRLARYRDSLAENGYQLIVLDRSQESVRWVRALRPWAVVMALPSADERGWKVLEALKSGRSTRMVPVIVCSEPGQGGQAISLGAAAFLPEPVSAQELLQTLGRLAR